MKAGIALASLVTVLMMGEAGSARAGLLFHRNKACCSPPPPVALRAEVLQRRYTVETKVENPPVVKTRVVRKDVPCTRIVTVPVTDPVTGCTHLEQRPQTVTEKVTYTVIDVCPPQQPFTVRKEQKVEQCLKVHIVPLSGMAEVPFVPASPTEPCR